MQHSMPAATERAPAGAIAAGSKPGSPGLRALPMVGAESSYTFTLSGPAESPPNVSPGTGSGYVSINTVSQVMTVSVVFSGLVGNTTAAHIHSPTTTPGSGTAGVATTTPSFPSFPPGVTSGTYNMTFNMTQASSYNPAFVTANGGTPASAFAALRAGIDGGRAYFNIHTNTFPSGEIRGFLVSVFKPRLYLPLIQR